MSTGSEGSLKFADEEKGATGHTNATSHKVQIVAADDGVKRDGGILGKMWAAVLWADSFGVEVRGVERVPEDERHHARPSDAGALWASANMTISTFSLGTLGNSIWYLELTDACLTILFFNLLCTIPVAIFSTWGKSTGLRQMIIGRYSFGTIGIYIPIILNCIACIGWSVVNTIVGESKAPPLLIGLQITDPVPAHLGHSYPGGQALAAVSDTHNLPVVAGIVIIAGVTLLVALFGYKIVHTFERYASIPVAIIFVIMLGQAAPHVTAAMGPPGAATAASVLSFGATVAGFALGWTSLASDYTVNLPAETSNTKVFAWTYMGLNIPLIFVECLGAIMMATFKQKSTWEDAYNSHHLGGLLGAPLVGPMGGFGRFLLVILGLSIIANNIPNMYSFALTFQAFGKAAQSIPRMFLVIIGTVIYIGLAIGGRNSFESVLDTLLVILAYWLIVYSVVLLEEHYIFRKGSFARGYDLDAYNTPSKLPIGLAAIGAICFGIAGAVVGMSQTWYVGPIGKMIGPPPFGGDIGFELSGGFAAIVYPALRYLELKYVGR